MLKGWSLGQRLLAQTGQHEASPQNLTRLQPAFGRHSEERSDEESLFDVMSSASCGESARANAAPRTLGVRRLAAAFALKPKCCFPASEMCGDIIQFRLAA
jgi:hypothetical protein